MKKEEAIKRLEEIIEASKKDGYEYQIKTNNLEDINTVIPTELLINGSRIFVSRTYFAIIETRDNSKHYKEKKFGYIDNLSGEYVPAKYGDLTKNYTFGGMKF